MELQESAKRLLHVLYDGEFQPDALRRELSAGKYTVQDVNTAALEYVDLCAYEWTAFQGGHAGEVRRDQKSCHIPEAVAILLDYGLDPNYVVTAPDGCSNIMAELQYIANGYVAADTLELLLEHGGNPSIILDGNSLIRDINFAVWFDLWNQEDRVRYDALVHYWFALLGYGAKLEHGEESLDYPPGFDIGKLKNHRNYYIGAIQSDRSDDQKEIVIFDRETNWEAARY